MSGRNRGLTVPMKGQPHGGLPPPPVQEPPLVRGLGGVPHPALVEEMRESRYSFAGPRPIPPHSAVIKEQLAAQHDEIQGMLVDNQMLAATHVALRQELEVAQFEFQRADKLARSLHTENDLGMRGLYEKAMKMENELHAVNATRAELMQVHMDIKELTAARQDLTAQVQMMTHDLARVTSDLQQVPTIKAEIEGLKQELDQARSAIEREKKGVAESLEHGKLMESKLISMAREMEKHRAELANAQKRAYAATIIGNPGATYNANYGNPEAGYSGYPYPVAYGTDPANSVHPAPAGADGYPPYGPGPGARGAYDTQQYQGSR